MRCFFHVGKSFNLNCGKVVVIIVKFYFAALVYVDLRVIRKQRNIKGLQNNTNLTSFIRV